MKKIYPVIHVENYSQALDNTKIASDAGADGVFLINHSISSESLFNIHSALIKFFTFPIGINCLGTDPFDLIFQIDNSIPMVWVDNAMIVEGATEQKEAQAIKDAIAKTNWNGQYFGGVAFKYQEPVIDLETVTKVAAQYMDIICTSGAGTGKAASPEKLKRMKSVLGEQPLAVASGITPENVFEYQDYVDIFLVSTGISKDFTNLDPVKVKDLVNKIHTMYIEKY